MLRDSGARQRCVCVLCNQLSVKRVCQTQLQSWGNNLACNGNGNGNGNLQLALQRATCNSLVMSAAQT